MTAPAYNAIVTQRIEVSPGLIILRISPDGWELPKFHPGQFGVIGLLGKEPRCELSQEEDAPAAPDALIRRAYSIASSPTTSDHIEFFVTLVTSGALTPRLFELKAGSRIWLSNKISGMFTLNEVPEEAHTILIATGTGLAPYMSMLRTHFVCGIDRRFAVLHGARHSWDLGYRAELSTMQRLCKNFTYLPIISRPNEELVEWRGEAGYVQHLWKKGVFPKLWNFQPTPQNTHIFLCGNPSMVDEAIAELKKDGFTEHTRSTPGQIHVERYW